MSNVETKQRDFSTPYPSVFEYLDLECNILYGCSFYKAMPLYPLTVFVGESDSTVDEYMEKDAYRYVSDNFTSYS